MFHNFSSKIAKHVALYMPKCAETKLLDQIVSEIHRFFTYIFFFGATCRFDFSGRRATCRQNAAKCRNFGKPKSNRNLARVRFEFDNSQTVRQNSGLTQSYSILRLLRCQPLTHYFRRAAPRASFSGVSWSRLPFLSGVPACSPCCVDLTRGARRNSKTSDFLQVFGGLVLGCIKTKFCAEVRKAENEDGKKKMSVILQEIFYGRRIARKTMHCTLKRDTSSRLQNYVA